MEAITQRISTPVFSVIIPLYNRVKTIGRSIESVLNQSFTDFELVVVNDCSTDASVEIVNSFILTDNRVKLLQMPQNGGAGAARNLGIKHSKGKLIALLDSDDYYHPAFLQTSLNYHMDKETLPFFTYTGVKEVEERESISKISPNPKPCSIWTIDQKFAKKDRPYLYDLKLGTAAGIVFNRHFFDKVGYFDESLKAAEDTDLFIRASEITLGAGIPFNLIFKDNTSEDRLTKNHNKIYEAYKIIFKKNKNLICNDTFLIKKWYYKLTRLALFNGKKGEAIKFYLNAFSVKKAFNIRFLLLLIIGLLIPRRSLIRLYTFLSITGNNLKK